MSPRCAGERRARRPDPHAAKREEAKPREIRITPSTDIEIDAGSQDGRPAPAERSEQDVRDRVRDPGQPVYVISVAASIVRVHPRTLRIYEDEGLLCPARTPTNIRLYSERDLRRVLWIRHLTQNLGVNLAGIRILFELEEKLGTPILETLYTEPTVDEEGDESSEEAPVVRRSPAKQEMSQS